MYTFQYSENEKIIGKAELYQVSLNNDKTSEYFMRLPLYKDIEEEFDELTCFKINYGALLTDVLSISNMRSGILISKKLKSIIEKYNLFDIRFIKSLIKHDGDLHEYYWVHIYQDLSFDIDYEKTSFVHCKRSILKSENVNITAPTRDLILELNRNKGLMDSISVKNGYCFSQENIKSLDILKIGHFDHSIYFSERLKNEIELRKITGIDFSESCWKNN